MTKYFILLNLLFAFFISYFFQSEIVTNDLIVDFYSHQLSSAQIEKMLINQERFEWIGYLFIPIFYLIKILAITLCIYSGVLILNLSNLTFSKIFSAIVIADMLFLIPGVIKIFWFSFQPDYTLEDLQYFMPGSLLNFFNPKEIEPWLVYPLQSINIWEVAFWFAMAYELKEYFENDFASSFGTVMSSYGSGLVIWIVFVVFLTLNFS
jgi:hypothetical protein